MKGIRARLLLALGVVATLAFFAAVAAIWAFLRVGDRFEQVVERDMPALLKAYEIARGHRQFGQKLHAHAEWFAGFIAFRFLRNHRLAEQHFSSGSMRG